MTLAFERRKVVVCLGTIITCLILANIGSLVLKYCFGDGHVLGLVPLFELDKEKNIPTLYSSMTLLFSSSLLSIIAVARKKNRDRDYLHWIALAAVFLFLSIDEFVTLHEQFNSLVRNALNTSGFLFFAWVIPYGMFVLILILVYMRFFLRLPAKTRNLTGFAAVIYIGGAIGFELIGGHYIALHKNDLTYGLITTCEESLEMIGVLCFISALLSYIESEFGSIYLRVGR